jgi:hypothetical protein
MRKHCFLTKVEPMPKDRGPWFMNDTTARASSSNRVTGGSGPRYVTVEMFGAMPNPSTSKVPTGSTSPKPITMSRSERNSSSTRSRCRHPSYLGQCHQLVELPSESSSCTSDVYRPEPEYRLDRQRLINNGTPAGFGFESCLIRLFIVSVSFK